MILTLDIGNTCIHAALFEEGCMKEKLWEPAKDLFVQIKNFSFNYKIKKICCSTPPHLKDEVESICKELFDISPCFLNASNQSILSIHYKTPQTLGADRIANAIAAKTLYGVPCIIVDAGSALTVDVVTERGFLGGFIIPGPGFMAKALSMIPTLPFVTFEKIEKIPDSTSSCISAGIYHAFVGAAKEAINFLKRLYPEASLIGTGGYINTLKENIDFSKIEPFLTLWGLWVWITNCGFCG